ncbi:MAG: VanZ family protein [Bacteroidales bacterium]|nr:VanZ family protein [Bacteroidales bacterium]
MKGRLKKTYIIVFCIYLSAVGVLCFMNPSDIPEIGLQTFLGIPIDKILHFLMFLPYPILAGLSFMNGRIGLVRNLIILTAIIITGIGVSYGTEVIQSHTEYRSYEINDFYADLTGIATGSLLTAAYITYTTLKK